MKRNLKATLTAGLAILLAATLALPVSAQKTGKKEKAKEQAKEQTPQGLKLKYNFPAGKPMTYSTKTDVNQEMDMNGTSMQVNVKINLVCTITGQGNDGENLKLNVRLDSLSQNVDSPQGAAGGPITEVEGKSFNMTITPLGKTVDLSEAEKLTYTAEGQSGNVAQNFTNYFPDFQDKELKPGDTWTTNDSIKSKATTMSMKQVVKADNKYEGIVNVDGIDCAKITAVVSGTREQTGESMGMDLLIKGNFTGTTEFYFSAKDGFLVKESSTSKLVGNIDISGGTNMSMPLIANTTSTRILKK